MMGDTGALTEVAISPDGTWLATCDDWIWRVWDAATGTERYALKQ